MKKSEILNSIKEIVRDITGDDDAEITEATTFEDVDGWDSVSNVKIILGIEDEFSIRFDVDEISSVENVAHLLDITTSKI
jgi:acyl carrier protein